MTGILISALFAFGGTFAVAILIASWKRHAAAFVALHGELRECSQLRTVTVTVREVKVRSDAVILRPAFSPSVKGRDRSPARVSALPAAA